MKAKFNIILALTTMFGLACGDGEDDRLKSSGEAQALAQELVGGKAKLATEKAGVWTVPVTMGNGATVTVELEAEDGQLVELEDKLGPFDYDMTPNAQFKSYRAGRDIALQAVTGQAVEAWNLRPLNATSEDDEEEGAEDASPDASGYRYEFYTKDESGQLWEIKLNAETGKILSEERKAKID